MGYPDRVSKSYIQEQTGKMRTKQWQDWLDAGVLNPPSEDGRWAASEVERALFAKDLQIEGRRLSRRVLLMEREDFRIPSLRQRRAAVIDVVSVLSRATHKATQVRDEQFAVGSGVWPERGRRGRRLPYELPAADTWPSLIAAATEDVFRAAYMLAYRSAGAMETVSRVHTPSSQIPYEERVALSTFLHLLAARGHLGKHRSMDVGE